MIKFLDLYAQYEASKADIDSAISRVIRNGAFIGGEEVASFESEFAATHQVRHCIGVANGTDAIEIALQALALPPGSEVIVPANSFISSSEAVTRSGLRVVFADVDPFTCTLDPIDVSRRITRKTKAIIAVHLYGHPARMDALVQLGQRHDLRVIEDCAQAHTAQFQGRPVGGIGDIGTFSFYPGKNLGAYGDAGAITTQDESLALKCRMIANHGRIDKYDHVFEGRNSRLDSLQAAILRAKLQHLGSWVLQRQKIACLYAEELKGIDGLTLPSMAEGHRHVFHLFVVRTARRDALAAHLKARGVQTGIHYPIALPKLRAYAYLNQGSEPMFANTADATLLSLPIGEHLCIDQAVEVTRHVRDFFV
jgi:dTDP-4-amino-4,6-dideoxygalactose transaminase